MEPKPPLPSPSPQPTDRIARPLPREPLVAIATALGLGILLGWALPLPSLPLALAGVVAAIGGGLFRGRTAACAALAAWLVVGAVRWELADGPPAPGDIASLFPATVVAPVELEGTIASAPEFHDPPKSAPAWQQLVRSRFDLDVTAVVAGQAAPATGRVAVTVDGHVLGFEPGDPIRLVGRLSTPSPPMNPGDFDFPAYLAGRGIRRIVRSDHPETVTRRDGPTDWRYGVARLRARLRARALALLRESLTPEDAALAGSLLLGDRTGMTEEIEDEFAASGTMHILAISGQHVVIFLMLVAVVLRGFNVAPGRMGWLLLAAVALYLYLTDQRPPVVRAALLTAFVLSGLRWGRVAPGLNALAATAIMLLLANPHHLFDIGAQLSFLAVAALVAMARLRRALRAERTEEPDLSPDPTWWRKAAEWLAAKTWTLLLLTAAVFVFTLPIQLATFHIAAPIGFVANVVLAPLVIIILGMGYALLGVGLLVPWLAPPLAALFSGGLWLFHAIIRGAANTPWGHFDSPGPPAWWSAVYYVLLLGGLFFARGRMRVWAAHSVAVWVVVGLFPGVFADQEPALRCTFVSVGHGGGILVEAPNGRTLLYDAGAMTAGDAAAVSIRNQLWRHGRWRIDAVVLSHADADHFSALPKLLESVPIGTVFVSRAFCDLSQPSVAAILDQVAAAGVPIRLLAQGDELQVAPAMKVTVLHPPAQGRDPLDNANSLVLEILFRGKRLLLTGDLEESGLLRLLAQQPRLCDLFLAPHHGSRTCNTPDLARWATPRVVVVSAGRGDRVEHLRQAYPHAESILSTGVAGCITVSFPEDGTMQVATWLKPAPSLAPRRDGAPDDSGIISQSR